ncbi:MAG: hypothetical protein AAGK97_09005 [Bacteroidota bacterium]
MKELFIVISLCFIGFGTIHGSTPEKTAVWNEYIEIRNMVNTNDFEKTLAMIESFEGYAQYPDIHCHTLIMKVHCSLQMSQRDSVQYWLDKAEVLINENRLDSLKAHLYRHKGISYFNSYNFNAAIPFLLEGLNFAHIIIHFREV